LKGARAALEQAQRDLLRRYGLTMDQVADAIRRTSLDMPGGNIKTESAEILLRTKGQAYSGEDYSSVVVTRDVVDEEGARDRRRCRDPSSSRGRADGYQHFVAS
jgi:Cu/Ag efflux pump CusA